MSRPTSTVEGAAGLVDEVEQPTATLWSDVWRKLKKDNQFRVAVVMIAIFMGMAIAPQLFFTKGLEPSHCHLEDMLQSPSRAHWFGTDLLGCDYYPRFCSGIRMSMEVGLIVASATMVIALTLGGAAG